LNTHACYSRANVTYVFGTAESLPFEDQTFDKVLSVSCLEHFADPERGIAEMARVLKPGGRIALSVDSLLPENSPESFRQWHKRRHFVPPDDPEAMAAAVRRILTEAGLARRLSQNARAKAKLHDWSVVLPQWKSLFRAVGSSSQPRKPCNQP